jgi:hypothetical protein
VPEWEGKVDVRTSTKRLRPLACFALLFFFPVGATGEEAAPGPRFEGAVRVGLAWPLYSTDYDQTLYLTAYPIWVDVGVRLSPLVFLGAYFSFAPTAVTPTEFSRISPCALDCYAREYHFGLELQVHPLLLPLGKGWALDPWVGLGGGYEVRQWRYDEDADCGCVEPPHVGAIQGPEWFLFQTGVSLSTGAFSFGPYFSASYGVYTSDAGISTSVPHWWLSVGLRFTVTPGSPQ